MNNIVDYIGLSTTKDKMQYIEDNCEWDDSNDILYLLLSFEYIKMRKKIDYSILGKHDIEVCIDNIMNTVEESYMHNDNKGFIKTTRALLYDIFFNSFFAINAELAELKNEDISSINHIKIIPTMVEFSANKQDCEDFFKCELHSSVLAFIGYMYTNHGVNYILIR